MIDLTFRGEYDYAVDDRGRTLLPPSFKTALGETVVIGRGAEGQLWIYPKESFERKLQQMQQAQQQAVDDDRHGDFETGLRFWLAAQEVSFDKQNRLAIPGLMRKQAGINSSVIVVGNGDRVELWNPDQYEQTYTEWVTDYKGHKDNYSAMRKAGLRP
jgi:MraZ protein